MLIFVGWIIVTVAMLGGFVYSGGHPASLFVVGEYAIILGIFIGYIVASSSMPVLKMMLKSILQVLKGSPYTQKRYIELIQAIYQMLVLARENGVIGLEEHLLNPKTSSIFTRYPQLPERLPRRSLPAGHLPPAARWQGQARGTLALGRDAAR